MEALKLPKQMRYSRYLLMLSQVCLFLVQDRKNWFIIVISNLIIIIAWEIMAMKVLMLSKEIKKSIEFCMKMKQCLKDFKIDNLVTMFIVGKMKGNSKLRGSNKYACIPPV